jgi:putative ABC transport system substrate-binding protein
MSKATSLAALTALAGIVGVFGSGCNRGAINVKRIAVFQVKPQEWADALKLGFADGLQEQGLEVGRDVVLVTKSAAGDPLGVTTLAQTLVRQHYAVVYALGTQASQEAFQAADINQPLIFGAVTDPVQTGFYDGSLDKPRKNITGTQDLWPYPAQFDLIKTLVPNLHKLGIAYNSSEINSQVSVRFIKQECAKRGIELSERTVTEDSQVSLAVAGVLDAGIQAFFIPADNTMQSNAQVVIAACMKRRIPVFTGISGIVENGAVGTVGTNYYELGKVNAAQAAKILSGVPARQIPVQIADKGDLYLNMASIKKLGLTVPEQLQKKAVKIYE